MSAMKDTKGVQAAVLGTLVSDASGMGLHWIYSQGKIRQVVERHGGVAEYLEPDRDNYEGVPSFFAHPRRNAGDGSNYSEYFVVLFRALTEEGFDRRLFIQAFQEYFGVGGEYVGYADTPMRETIYNLALLTRDLEKRVATCESSFSREQREAAGHFIARYALDHDLPSLKQQVRNLLKLKQWSAADLDEADRVIHEVMSDLGTPGADDDQMPALTRSAVLAHFYSGEMLNQRVDEAVRLTNDNDTAVAAGKFMAQVMRTLYEAGTPLQDPRQTLRAAVEHHVHLLEPATADLVGEALALEDLDIRGATKRFGAACHVNMAVPLVVHLLLTTSSFRDANRQNILASGDNCGRAVMLGAMAGAMYGVGGENGVPEEWIWRTTLVERLRDTPGAVLLR